MMRAFAIFLLLSSMARFANAQTISIKGSDTLGAKLIPQIAEKYKAKGHPLVKFEIAAEGSSTAFTALADGSAEIGMSSRKAEEEEMATCRAKGINLVEQMICRDMMCVLINQSSPITNLTKTQVRDIFTGQIKNWSEVGGAPGPISIYTRNNSSGAYKDWQKMAMEGRNYAEGSQKMAGGEQINQLVAKKEGGICHVNLTYSKTPGTKTVSIDGVAAVAESAKTYPFTREFYLYVSDKASAETKSFIDFVLSPEGQAIVQITGFIPSK
jgi:phosphate transport system substrate-binding protein